MIDAKRLLADLKRMRKRLEDDLRAHHAASAGRAAVAAEWQAASAASRTRDTFETFWSAALDQAAVHWILDVVFLRFLEDNALLERPLLSGPGERLDLAQERQRGYFRAHPHDSDAEYLLATFGEVSALPGLSRLYDPAHNPLFRLPLSGDGAMALLGFFRAKVPETGALVHDFTDPDWNTRFLGDLYQDLSEDARKRYALLQTPDFVEDWILSRTLDPAIGEFGYDRVRMIDPACGSGHFLLGGFARLLAQWQRAEPDMPPAAQAQRALDGVAGVDLNPFAVEVARFRLLLAALQAAEVARLAAAPDFHFRLAVGDSLLHGRHFARHELGGGAEGFGHLVRHNYAAEDMAALDAILGQQYHAVVGNPPYITPKDPAMRDAYRKIYASCHMKYHLDAPFIERFFDLAQTGTPSTSAGFVGLITANGFMKREFGAKLIEEVLPRLDLTHVVDSSLAQIPGHGTPTVILFGRNRLPVAGVVRTVRGIRGEPKAPKDSARGLVWTSIVAQTDSARSVNEFISTEDTPRTVLASHPWNMGGGGAAEAQATIERSPTVLGLLQTEIGPASFPGADDVFIASENVFSRLGTPKKFVRSIIVGDNVRDYGIEAGDNALVPYREDNTLAALKSIGLGVRFLWNYRTTLSGIVSFGGKTKGELGEPWWCWYRWIAERYRTPLTITFAFVTTHNHFVFDRGGSVFNRSAPVIKLPYGSKEDDYLSLLGLLNSSTACFWIKQVCHNKGGQGINEGAKAEAWERFLEVSGTRLELFPLPSSAPLDLARALDTEAQTLTANLPTAVRDYAVPNGNALNIAQRAANGARARMIALQEELDWRCYSLYGLCDDAPEHPDPPGLRLGERAFEIVMARQMAAGTLETAWFSRHGSTPITDLPAAWPDDYRDVVERRITLIESDPTIGLIERPEYKRRWSMQPWAEMERDALRLWLLDRLEDPRYWPADDPRLTSTRAVADAARRDVDFMAVAELYVGRAGFDLDALLAELVARETVPFLAALRYSETGLRKRADWDATWDKQRAEDAIDADLAARRDVFLRAAWAKAHARREGESAEDYAGRMQAGLGEEAVQQAADRAIAAEAKQRKQAEVGTIPVPPKYRTPDFQSQDFWRLRGGLDVPKERFVSFPHCARDADGSLPVLWAGFDQLARARALSTWYVERKDSDGWPAARLVPLLAGLLELRPWLLQWHNDRDPASGERLGEYFASFIAEEARELGMTEADLRAWTPPATARRGRRPRNAA